MSVILVNFLQKTIFFHIFSHFFSGFHHFQSLIRPGFFIKPSEFINYFANFKLVFFAHFKIIRVVSRSDFYHAGAKIYINHLIADDFHFGFTQKSFNFNFLTNVLLVSFVFGIDGHGRVAKFRFGSDRG